MTEQSTRIFIPVGACVEEPTAALFDNSETFKEAAEACNGCIQLEHCTTQREAIGDAIALEGIKRAVVGGQVLDLKKKRGSQLAQPYFEHREPTFNFEFRPLPTDGERGLWTLQQAYRSGRLYGRKQQHPTMNVGQLFANIVWDRDEHIYEKTMEDPAARDLITTLILSAVARRKPWGEVYPGAEKYADFEPDAYSEIVWQYAQQGAQLKRLGLPPARAAVHNPDFYKTYFQSGRQAGITRGLLQLAATTHKRGLLLAASRLQENNARGAVRQRKKRQQLPPKESVESPQARLLHIAVKNKIAQMDGEKPDLHENLDYLDSYERAAVIFTYGLQENIDPGMSLHDLQQHHKDPARLTHTILLPSVHALRVAQAHFERKLISPAQFVLQQARSGLWTGHYRAKGKKDVSIATLATAMYDMFGGEADYVEETEQKLLNSLAWLNIIAKRYYTDQGSKLPDDVFYKMGIAYVRDVRTLQRHKQVDPERVAMYYNPATYLAIRDYGLQKYPEMSASVVTQGFLRNIRTPLSLVAQTTRRFYELKPSLEDQGLPDTAIRNLARRRVADDEVKQVVHLIAELAEETRGKLTIGAVAIYCTARTFNAETLRAGILEEALKKHPHSQE